MNTIGDSDIYIQVDYAFDTSRHNQLFRSNNIDNTKIIYLHPPNTNEVYSQPDLLIDTGSHDHTFSRPNNIGNNKINSKSTSGTSDNCPQGAMQLL